MATETVAAAVAAVSVIAAAAAGGCAAGAYDPLAEARQTIAVANPEASVPLQCYAQTGASNTCWTCHAEGQGTNLRVDLDLQSSYDFSDFARENHWRNAFLPAGGDAADIDDEEMLAWVRQDNYRPLQRALQRAAERPAFVPDVDLHGGFDELGFARDGSAWRALRYQPFPGSGWPTNGSAGDAFVRLPPPFRENVSGAPSTEIYRANLTILEAAIAADPSLSTEELVRGIEPIDEMEIGVDLDGDGVLGRATRLRGLPARYVGGAADIAVTRYQYPAGAELLHTVRYLDPSAPGMMARRMKEVRYARKVEVLDAWANARAYEREAEEKAEGALPQYRGAPEVGLRNDFGWQLTGYIEDARGRLRLQTAEEHRACMGCHSAVGVTVDHTFSLARKVPGRDGWRMQTLEGLSDRPQVGHAEGEALAYMKRAGRADDYGANAEMNERFFSAGEVDAAAVRRAAPGGDRDLAWLLSPSRERALRLDKAYLVLVREQRFAQGRDAFADPPRLVHRAVRAGQEAAQRTWNDGRLHLRW
jgi:hypothetical protein